MAAPPDTTLSGRPIASLTFAINYALARRDPRDLWGYHVVNLAIHILAALVLFGIVRRTLAGTRMRERFGAAATPLAFVTSLIWLVHPLHTGSVTYVVQRVESLMGLFYLLTLYCAIRSAEETGRTSNGWITGAIVACALGMATKEVMVTAPLMVLLWDWTFGSSGIESRRASRWPLYVGLAATWMIVAALAAAGPRVHAVGFGFPDWPWPTYLITQAGVVAHYLRLAIVPSPLVLDYEWPAAQSIVDVAPQAAMLLALIAVTIWALVRRMPIGFAGAWFFGILAPTSSVIPIVTEIAAEHRMYLPLAAVIAVGVIGAYVIWPRTRPRLVLTLSAGAVVAALAFLTNARSRDYHDYERIWLDTIQKRPSNSRARNNYASALLVHGHYAEAETHLRAAVRVRPDFAEAHANLGIALCARGAFDEGIAHLQRAVAIQPDYWQAYQDLGEAFASQGRFAPAISSYAKALEGRTNDVMLLNRIAWILATSSDADLRDGVRAATLAERAVRLTNREDAASLDSLAAAYAELGRYGDASTTAGEALALARKKGDPAIAPELESRLALYQAHRPFREAAVRQR
ncbi:MAG TPA: tetratricopeptide repeat protein [Roseiflexaceae bacterium]